MFPNLLGSNISLPTKKKQRPLGKVLCKCSLNHRKKQIKNATIESEVTRGKMTTFKYKDTLSLSGIQTPLS